MRWSRAFLPVLKESPSDAQIVSHKLMLRAGLVRQTAAGIYAWLPLGFRVLKKIEQIVREEQDRAGAQEMLMPTLQSAELWRESGRYDAYGPEMLRIRDRHEREMLYGPTNEEMITALFRDEVKSYRDLPRTLYHIQWKFRDEVRPRFGVMRGREFLMKDAYSFDLDEAGARQSYYTQMLAYLRTFQRMGIQAVPMKAASGPIGGDLSHEFIVLAPTGESEVFYDAAYEAFDWHQSDLELWRRSRPPGPLRPGQFDLRRDRRDPRRREVGGAARRPAAHRPRDRGRAHLLLRRQIFGGDGPQGVRAATERRSTPMMGSYGVGVSRLVGAIIEASHDEAGIVWPEAVAPWRVGLVTMRADDEPSMSPPTTIYAQLTGAGIETLYDDRDERGGVKLGSMDLIGLPWQLIVGPRGIASGTVELKRRSTGETRGAEHRKRIGKADRMILNRAERMLARRYLLPGKGEGFIFLVAAISLIAVALGVAAMIIVMSVMNGFRAELFDKIVGLNGHAVIQGYDGRLPDWQRIADAAKKTPGVTSALPLIEQPLMATANGRFEGVLVRGMRVEDIRSNKTIAGNVLAGDIKSITPGSNRVAIGSRARRNARRLSRKPDHLVESGRALDRRRHRPARGDLHRRRDLRDRRSTTTTRFSWSCRCRMRSSCC